MPFPTEEQFWARVSRGEEEEDACWEWQGSNTKSGYGRVWVDTGHIYAHRVSWELTHGISPRGHVLHRCDNPICVRPEHLFVGSDLDNVRDAISKGRFKFLDPRKGTEHHNAKITDKQVREIRQLRNQGISCRAVGAMFNISGTMVSNIANRKNWAHVE